MLAVPENVLAIPSRIVRPPPAVNEAARPVLLLITPSKFMSAELALKPKEREPPVAEMLPVSVSVPLPLLCRKAPPA